MHGDRDELMRCLMQQSCSFSMAGGNRWGVLLVGKRWKVSSCAGAAPLPVVDEAGKRGRVAVIGGL